MNLPTSSVTSLKRFSMSSVESLVSLLIFSNASLTWSNSSSNPLRSCLSTLSNKSIMSFTFSLKSLPESTISLNWLSSLLNLDLSISSIESVVSSSVLLSFLPASLISSNWSSTLPSLALPKSSSESSISAISCSTFLAAFIRPSNCSSNLSPILLEPRASIASARPSISFCAFFIALLNSVVDAVILILTRFSLTLCSPPL